MNENLRNALEMMGYRQVPNADRPIWAKPIGCSVLIFDTESNELLLVSKQARPIVWCRKIIDAEGSVAQLIARIMDAECDCDCGLNSWQGDHIYAFSTIGQRLENAIAPWL